MLLKRHYRRPDGWEPERNSRDARGVLVHPHRKEGVLLNPQPFSHIEIKHTGLHPEQNFSTRLVGAGIEEGWISVQDGKLIVHAEPEPLVYDIVAAPGRYSCFDGEKLPDDPEDKGTLARQALAHQYPGMTSPDPDHPAGYYKINYYECVLNAAQQEQFGLRKQVGK